MIDFHYVYILFLVLMCDFLRWKSIFCSTYIPLAICVYFRLAVHAESVAHVT